MNVPITIITNGFCSLGIVTPCKDCVYVDEKPQQGEESFLLHANILRYYAYIGRKDIAVSPPNLSAARDAVPVTANDTPVKKLQALSLGKPKPAPAASKQMKPSQENTDKYTENSGQYVSLLTAAAVEQKEFEYAQQDFEEYFYTVMGKFFPVSLRA